MTTWKIIAVACAYIKHSTDLDLVMYTDTRVNFTHTDPAVCVKRVGGTSNL